MCNICIANIFGSLIKSDILICATSKKDSRLFMLIICYVAISIDYNSLYIIIYCDTALVGLNPTSVIYYKN